MHDGVDGQLVSGRKRHLWIPERGEVTAGETGRHKIVGSMYLFQLQYLQLWTKVGPNIYFALQFGVSPFQV